MLNGERGLSEPGFLEELLGRDTEALVELGDKGSIRAGGEARFFVKEVKDTEFAFNKVNTWLIVVEVNEGLVKGETLLPLLTTICKKMRAVRSLPS